MNHVILLIDFENVRDMSLASLPPDYRVLIFVGRSQNSIPFDVTREAQQLGNRLEWIKIEGDGRNNLDFHLAFHLGQLSAKHRDAEFLVLSKDKGFDPVIRHAAGTGLRCSRVESVAHLVSPEVQVDDPHFEKALKILSGIEKKSRPRKRKTLEAQVASFFQKKEPAAEIQRIVNVLFAKKLITEAGNALTYNF
jgi:PIN domain